MTKVIGYAAGEFDLFHVGHLNILKYAKSRCDYLIAGVVSDEIIELAKGTTPVVPLTERLEIVGSLDCVDEARAETLPNKIDTWRDVRFTMFFKGDDWQGTSRGERLEREFATVGVTVEYFPHAIRTMSPRMRMAHRLINRLGPSELAQHF